MDLLRRQVGRGVGPHPLGVPARAVRERSQAERGPCSGQVHVGDVGQEAPQRRVDVLLDDRRRLRQHVVLAGSRRAGPAAQPGEERARAGVAARGEVGRNRGRHVPQGDGGGRHAEVERLVEERRRLLELGGEPPEPFEHVVEVRGGAHGHGCEGLGGFGGRVAERPDDVEVVVGEAGGICVAPRLLLEDVPAELVALVERVPVDRAQHLERLRSPGPACGDGGGGQVAPPRTVAADAEERGELGGVREALRPGDLEQRVEPFGDGAAGLRSSPCVGIRACHGRRP